MATMENIVPEKRAPMGFIVPKVPRKKIPHAEFIQWINDMDYDGDGVISKKELEKAIRKLGLLFPGWKTKQALEAVDANNNGLIDTDEEMNELIDIAENYWGLEITNRP